MRGTHHTKCRDDNYIYSSNYSDFSMLQLSYQLQTNPWVAESSVTYSMNVILYKSLHSINHKSHKSEILFGGGGTEVPRASPLPPPRYLHPWSGIR